MKRMPFFLTQNQAALSFTPSAVKLRFSRGGSFIVEKDGVLTSASEGYYDWQESDYTLLPGGHVYDVKLVLTKPGSVTPSGPETVPAKGFLQVAIEEAI